MPTTVRAFATGSPKARLGPHSIPRRDPGPRDVVLDVLFCGVCHSDVHTARSEWSGTTYPCVPGHEIVGRVTAAGSAVSSFRVGELGAVGCLVDSCKECADCRAGLEQHCTGGATWTYNSDDPHLPGHRTYGGYSASLVVDERYCLRLPASLDPARAAPLLCAGITTYSPLRHWGAAPGRRVGVVGLGGLGHMGVRLSRALGAHTVAFTSSPGKLADALRLGAHEAVPGTDDDALRAHHASFDIVLDTVSASHDLDRYTSLLDRDGTLVLVGVPEHPHPSPDVARLIRRRRRIAGSLIGGVQETQEMLDFCAAHNIVSDIETIPMQGINEAYDRMVRGDVRYRFVIDMATLK